MEDFDAKPYGYIKYGRSYLFKIPFFPQRKFVIGPHWLGVIATLCVIFGGAYMNYRILHKKTQTNPMTEFYITQFIYFMSIGTTIFLFFTAFNDPGIVFPNNNTTRKEIDEWNLNQIPICRVCNIPQHQKLDIGHCYECGYCIEGLDHHCPWMGQCIGKKNMT